MPDGAMTDPAPRTAHIDLDINGDAEREFEFPDRCESEELLEDVGAGRVVMANRGNRDEDFWHDFVDGYGYVAASTSPSPGMKFVPVVLEVSCVDPSEAMVRIAYDASDPCEDVRLTRNGWEFWGRARLWLKDGEAVRNGDPLSRGGDYIAPGDYSLAQLGIGEDGQAVLYFEMLVESVTEGDLVIEVTLDGDGDGGIDAEDRIRITGIRVEFYELDPTGELDLPTMLFADTDEYDASLPAESDVPDDEDVLPWPEIIECCHQPVAYEGRLHDPRDLNGRAFTVNGVELAIRRGEGYWVTEPFWFDGPPHYAQPGLAEHRFENLRRIIVREDDDIVWSYD